MAATAPITGTSAPVSATIFRSTPLAGASTSSTAFSVSTVRSGDPSLTASPSWWDQPVIVPDEAEVIATEIRLAVADGARVVITTGGTGSGQTRTISDYVAATRVVTVSVAWTTAPDATTTFEIGNQNRLVKSITFNATSDRNWYIGNDIRNSAAVLDSGTGNDNTTFGNLT